MTNARQCYAACTVVRSLVTCCVSRTITPRDPCRNTSTTLKRSMTSLYELLTGKQRWIWCGVSGRIKSLPNKENPNYYKTLRHNERFFIHKMSSIALSCCCAVRTAAASRLMSLRRVSARSWSRTLSSDLSVSIS